MLLVCFYLFNALYCVPNRLLYQVQAQVMGIKSK